MSGDESSKEPEYSPYGRVVDEAGASVVGATIASEPIGRRGPIHAVGVVSGRDGRFVDHQIYRPGDYRITVSADGFRSRSEVVHVDEDGWDGGELELVLEAAN
jgi:Carboxypeptidase regulatory-like domain